jgi:hypothetical protein
MGYRSDVMAVFYTDKQDEFPGLKLFVEENFPSDLKSGLERLKSSKYFGFVFSEEDTKWYEGDPDVRAFDTFLELFLDILSPSNASGDPYEGIKRSWYYEFVRVGEDAADIDEARSLNADGLLYVSRAIRLDL